MVCHLCQHHLLPWLQLQLTNPLVHLAWPQVHVQIMLLADLCIVQLLAAQVSAIAGD